MRYMFDIGGVIEWLLIIIQCITYEKDCSDRREESFNQSMSDHFTMSG